MNLYKFYYKDYFKGVRYSWLLDKSGTEEQQKRAKQEDVKLIASANREVLSTRFVEPAPLPLTEGVDTVRLEVQYPGLITGIGIGHEANVDGEFKLGIHLDYLTGMPIIYGSTVKGVLRSAFQDTEFIQSLFQAMRKAIPTEAELKELEADIFGSSAADTSAGKPVSCRDIFFDAVLCKAGSIYMKEKGQKNPVRRDCIFCSDSITPHNTPGTFEPVPLTFVKVAAGAVFEFRFRLVDSALLKKEGKLDLFTRILLEVGIGAKRNVGYGNLKKHEQKQRRYK